ncbi:MAG: NfeD family protein [Bacteroidetes bacterium]|nr:NfeD family protein [Bacteroidota bacterium]
MNHQAGFTVKDQKLETLMGQIAYSVTDLRPSGKIELNGERYEAITDDGFIAKNSPVKISGIRLVIWLWKRLSSKLQNRWSVTPSCYRFPPMCIGSGKGHCYRPQALHHRHHTPAQMKAEMELLRIRFYIYKQLKTPAFKVPLL